MPDKGFFDEEVRDGISVPTERKKLWAKELEIMEEVDRICQKYHLKYYAFAGTMLGAVRHKGFIPWDDDIDLAMWREDYEIFQKVAPSELKDPYFFQTPITDPCFGSSHAKVRNSNTTCATRYEFTLDFNKGIFLDIFPLDKIPDDRSELEASMSEIKKAFRILQVGVKKFYYLGDETISEEEKQRVADYLAENGTAKAFSRMEELIGRYNMRDTKRCGWVLHPDIFNVNFLCEDFTETVDMPFENITLPVPKAYDRILRSHYGDDYMTPKPGGAIHGKMLISTEIPFDRFVVPPVE